VDGWSDLDGEVGHHRGWWVRKSHLEKCLNDNTAVFKVVKEMASRGVPLKDLTGSIVAGLENGDVFLEFEDHVNGCSADGHGKAGHCVAIATKYLSRVVDKKKAKDDGKAKRTARIKELKAKKSTS
jgi:hypothetical protein